MAWTGKLIGGLIGGMVAGPAGAGFGATLGHVIADGTRRLELVRLDWRHHAFSASGPGMWMTPVWWARGLAGKEVRVRLDFGDAHAERIVDVERAAEECRLPKFFVPYATAGRVARVRLSAGTAADDAQFDVAMPTPLRQLAGSGPARVVMALVGCARDRGREFQPADERYIRDTFVEGHGLDELGIAWLNAWLKELRTADVARLAPALVANRLTPHLDDEARVRLLRWLLRSVEDAWAGQDPWVDEFAAGFGVGDLSQLRAEIRAQQEGFGEAWATLGLHPSASPEQVRAAWHALVQAHHPDRGRTPDEVAERTRRLAEINAAYRTLRE